MSIINALLKEPEDDQPNLDQILDPQDMSNLRGHVIGTAIRHQDLINASISSGGPSSLNDAIIQAMDICKVPIEKLSKKTNVSKYRLNKMLAGEMDMTTKILGRIMTVFHQARPDLYPAD